MIRTVMFLLVSGLLLIAIACGDGEGDEGATPTSTVAPAETPTPSADGETSGAEGFRQFVPTFQEALDEGDTSFLRDRALTEAVVCTAEDLQGGLGAPPCEFEGQEFDGFLEGYWRSEGGIVRVEDAFSAYDTMLATDLPAESDDFGDGSVQVYALDIGENSFNAIVTAIVERPSDFGGGGPLRVSYGTAWAFEGGRWMVTSTLTAYARGEDFLVPSDEGRPPYANWERYEGS